MPPNEEVRESHGLAANLVYDFGGLQLRSISGYRKYDVSAAQDLAYNLAVAQFGGGRTTSEEAGEQFSQEFRLTGQVGPAFRWTAGAFYQDTTFDYGYFSVSPVVGTYDFLSDYERREVAGYGEGTLTIARGLDLIAGVRVSNEKHEIETAVPAFGSAFSGTEDFTLVTPKFAVAYHLDSDRQVYVSAIRR